jgi:tetratricopeptide (TPR) repeat protein
LGPPSRRFAGRSRSDRNQPALSNLGAVQLLEGKAAEALATFRQVGREGFRLAGIAMAEHALSHVKESQQALDELIAKHAQDSAYQIAKVYAWRGEKDKAFEWLERAYHQRDGALSEIKVNVLLASLRGDARFAAMLRKMQLPE